MKKILITGCSSGFGNMTHLIKFLLLLTAICFGNVLFGQTQVKGRIIEESGKPLPFANILLFASADSTYLKWEESGKDGAFILSNLTPGSYRIEVRMVGHFTYQSEVFYIIDEPGELLLDDIVLPLDRTVDARSPNLYWEKYK